MCPLHVVQSAQLQYIYAAVHVGFLNLEVPHVLYTVLEIYCHRYTTCKVLMTMHDCS